MLKKLLLFLSFYSNSLFCSEHLTLYDPTIESASLCYENSHGSLEYRVSELTPKQQALILRVEALQDACNKLKQSAQEDESFPTERLVKEASELQKKLIQELFNDSKTILLKDPLFLAFKTIRERLVLAIGRNDKEETINELETQFKTLKNFLTQQQEFFKITPSKRNSSKFDESEIRTEEIQISFAVKRKPPIENPEDISSAAGILASFKSPKK